MKSLQHLFENNQFVHAVSLIRKSLTDKCRLSNFQKYISYLESELFEMYAVHVFF
jgi:hypothetical protein